ncbi:putative cyclin-D6-1 [Senna tora]|uniref:Putative cyclin-D6-1 n=1 Tax=Senna tora TaxID=362788 RepID=A0A834WJ49_9FABA|nr:putative cyclin-D6-1 [Senna tora]
MEGGVRMMDYHPEFPLDSHRLSQCVDDFHRNEHYFMPNPDYLQSHRKMQIRKHAIRTIAQYTDEVTTCFREMIEVCMKKNIEIEPECVEGEIGGESLLYPWTKSPWNTLLHIEDKASHRDWNFDVVRMDYYPDRELDYHPEFPLSSPRLKQSVEELYDNEHHFMPTHHYLQSPRMKQLRNHAIRTIAQRRNNIEIAQERIELVEYEILEGLERRSRPITPFCFLNTYYPRFRDLGGFSRRCIHQIIVNSLAEECFTQYKPSLIAQSSFLAAAHILYGPGSLHVTENEVTPCFREMIELCIRKKIEMESASVDGNRDEESELYQWTKRAKDVVLCIEEIEQGPDRDWDFDVQWHSQPTD